MLVACYGALRRRGAGGSEVKIIALRNLGTASIELLNNISTRENSSVIANLIYGIFR